MQHRSIIISVCALFLLTNFFLVSAFRQPHNIKTQAVGAPLPTLICLGSCTASPTPAIKPTVTTALSFSGQLCGQKSNPPLTQAFACAGFTATEKSSDGYYYATRFACNSDLAKDSQNKCITACESQGIPECGDGKTGAACEEAVQWYSANADQYGCNTKLKITNPANGKAVIVRVIDRGPTCVDQKNGRGNFAISQATYTELGINGAFATKSNIVQVEEVSSSTPLGPIPVCTNQ